MYISSSISLKWVKVNQYLLISHLNEFSFLTESLIRENRIKRGTIEKRKHLSENKSQF